MTETEIVASFVLTQMYSVRLRLKPLKMEDIHLGL